MDAGTLLIMFLLIAAPMAFVLDWKKKQRREEERTYLNDKQWRALTKLLMQTPEDAELQRKTLNFVQREGRYSADAYEIALRFVEKYDTKRLKIFALDVGRVHYGKLRPGGVPTVYDEAAIDNDIKARC